MKVTVDQIPEVNADGLKPGARADCPAARADEIQAAREWIRAACVLSGKWKSSYELKHSAERAIPAADRVDRWGRKFSGHYISNGALVLAALLEGYEGRADRSSPNVEFKMKVRS